MGMIVFTFNGLTNIKIDRLNKAEALDIKQY